MPPREKHEMQPLASNTSDWVYHLTSSDVIDIDKPLLLKPDPDRGKMEDWREMEKFVDAHRPGWVKALEITRRDSVFAYTTIMPINSGLSMGAWPEYDNLDTAHRVAVGIKIDPKKTLVCDAKFLDPGLVMWAQNYRQYEKPAREMANRYWGSAISLEDFREVYDQNYMGGNSASQKMLPNNQAPLPGYALRYGHPEALVSGPIYESDLHIAAMGIHHQIEQFNLDTPYENHELAA
jgi:hypothetical protein